MRETNGRRTVKQLRSEDLRAKPDWLLMEFDFQAQKAILLHMDENLYRTSSFLDHRIGAGREYSRIDIEDLCDVFDSDSAVPQRFIFHTGYCCSTFLSRCLEFPDATLLLREPLILHGLARLRLDVSPSASSHTVWRSYLHLAGQSLARTYRESQRPIVKLDCTHLLPHLSTQNGPSRTIFLYQDMESFLVSVLKDRHRMEWFRSRIPLYMRYAKEFSVTRDAGRWIQDASSITAADAAALHWLFNTTILKRQAKSDSGVRSLNCSHLLADPLSVIRLIRDHLQLNVGDRELEENVRGHLSIHAKSMTTDFSAGLYLREMDELKRKYSAKLRSAVKLLHRLHPSWDRSIPASLV